MIFPDINKFNSYHLYLEEFININKQDKKSPISFQYLANKLNWPRTYLHDIINHRKNLTVGRALEFSQFAKMDLYDTEKLLYLSLKDSDNQIVNNYFEQQLSQSHNQDRPKLDRSYEIKTNSFKEIALWQYINLTNKIPTLEFLNENISVFKELEKDEYKLLLNTLVKGGAIKIGANNTGRTLVDQLLVEDSQEAQSALIRNFAESVIDFSEAFTKPKACYNFMFYLTDGEIKPFHAKIFKLINWIANLVNSYKDRHKNKDLRLYQFSLNFFPISNHIDNSQNGHE